jgi:hypothetical protein
MKFSHALWTTLALSFALPLQANAVSFASMDAEIEESMIEVDAILAETHVDESKREERVLKRLDRRFDRQFKRFARRVNRVLKKHSDEELREIFASHEIRHGALIGAALDQDGAYSIAVNENGGFIGIRAALEGLTTPEHREELRAKLHAEIAQAGGAVAFLKTNRKALSLFRSINGCLWKDVALRYVAPTAAFAGGVTLALSSFSLLLTFGNVSILSLPMPWNFLVHGAGLGGAYYAFDALIGRAENPTSHCRFIPKKQLSDALAE